jgi:integrase
MKTHARYEQIVHSHLIPRMGAYELEELTPQLLQHQIVDMGKRGNRRTGKGLAPSTLNLIVAVIQDSLTTAYSIEITKVYAADKIKRPRIEEKKVECFTVAEQKVLEEAIKNDRRMKTFGILLSLYTGLRIGELLALEWTDVDFDKRELSISKTCHDSKDEFGRYVRFVNPPKTSTSMRVIPIPKQLIPLLREMKKKNSSKYVVGDGDKVISVRSYQRTYELILKKHGLPHRGFHALRHTFATRAIECGIDVKTLSEILGHKNPTVTLNRYAHSLMEHKKDMMNRLGKLFIE